MKWASFMARTKDLIFEIQDDSIVTQEGALALYSKLEPSLASEDQGRRSCRIPVECESTLV